MAFTRLTDLGEIREQDSHRELLNPALAALAELAIEYPDPEAGPHALVIALPASLGLHAERVEGEAPKRWRNKKLPSISAMVSDQWKILTHRKRRTETPICVCPAYISRWKWLLTTYESPPASRSSVPVGSLGGGRPGSSRPIGFSCGQPGYRSSLRMRRPCHGNESPRR